MTLVLPFLILFGLEDPDSLTKVKQVVCTRMVYIEDSMSISRKIAEEAFEYHSNGKIAQRSGVKYEADLDKKYYFKYDNEGRLIEAFNDRGNLDYDPKQLSVYVYGKNKKLYETFTYQQTEPLPMQRNKAHLASHTVYRYNKKDSLIQEFKHGLEDAPYQKCEYAYERGNRITELVIDLSTGQNAQAQKRSMFYDMKNRLIIINEKSQVAVNQDWVENFKYEDEKLVLHTGMEGPIKAFDNKYAYFEGDSVEMSHFYDGTLQQKTISTPSRELMLTYWEDGQIRFNQKRYNPANQLIEDGSGMLLEDGTMTYEYVTRYLYENKQLLREQTYKKEVLISEDLYSYQKY